jgi:hypothetical protein
VSLHDFGEVEANFLDRTEKEFENQLYLYVELIDIAYFDFYIFLCLISKLHVVNLISMVFHFMYV